MYGTNRAYSVTTRATKAHSHLWSRKYALLVGEVSRPSQAVFGRAPLILPEVREINVGMCMGRLRELGSCLIFLAQLVAFGCSPPPSNTEKFSANATAQKPLGRQLATFCSPQIALAEPPFSRLFTGL